MNDSLLDLLEKWNKGERSEVAEDLSRRSYNQIFAFAIMIHRGDNGPEELKALAKLVDVYRDGHD